MVNEKQIFQDFDKETQSQYESYLVDRFGDRVKEHIQDSHYNTRGWTMQDWQKSGKEFDDICKDLVVVMKQEKSIDSPEAQIIIKRHYDWLKKFWTPNKESYIGLGQGYTEKEWNDRFASYHPQLAYYLSEGMKIFAENNLS